MREQSFFYKIEPRMKKVSYEEFLFFINNYPRKLVRDAFGAFEPPLLTYNDFELANRWPYSVVAQTFLYDDDPDDYYYCPAEHRTYLIMENFEECFLSKTGNKAED